MTYTDSRPNALPSHPPSLVPKRLSPPPLASPPSPTALLSTTSVTSSKNDSKVTMKKRSRSRMRTSTPVSPTLSESDVVSHSPNPLISEPLALDTVTGPESLNHPRAVLRVFPRLSRLNKPRLLLNQLRLPHSLPRPNAPTPKLFTRLRMLPRSRPRPRQRTLVTLLPSLPLLLLIKVCFFSLRLLFVADLIAKTVHFTTTICNKK